MATEFVLYAQPHCFREVFSHPEWLPLIENNLIDFIRCHISVIA